MLPDDMVTRTRDFIGQTDSSKSTITDAQILAALNEGLSDLVVWLDEDPVSTDTSLSTVEDQFEYALQDKTFALAEVFITDTNSKLTKLRVVQSRDLVSDILGPTWPSDDAGQPTVAYKASFETLGLAPKPNSDWASKTIEIKYHKLPADMTAGGSAPDIPDVIHPTLPFYAAWLLWRRLGDHQQAKMFRDDYFAKRRDLRFNAQRFTKEEAFEWGSSVEEIQ